MTRRIQFTPPARAQFLAAVAYIRADRPGAALSFRHRVNDALSHLTEFPDAGRIAPEFPDLKFREVIIVDSYRFFYRLESETIWVVGVWHGAQIPDIPDDSVDG
ncbi:MAG: type II toxin-antitoxin system RelE/ParE family toxin [Coriobacteriia bacterium]|nr:type II toxin-antitoxin system RelE/ParE family toxin [Coriobacteriia bacterium]